MTRVHTNAFVRSGTACGMDGENEYVVTYTITPGSPERGNFGPVELYDPGSAPEADLLTVECDGINVPIGEFPTPEWSWLYDQVIENHDFADDAADRADYLYDQMRDRRMDRDQ